MDIYEIFEYLLYCYFFLLVDCVLEVEFGKLIYVYKNIMMNELYFVGYFFYYLVMLGVLIMEVLVQVVGILFFKIMDSKLDVNFVFYFVGIDECCFKKLVMLGDQLYLYVEIFWQMWGIWKYKVEVWVDGQVVVEVILMCVKWDV